MDRRLTTNRTALLSLAIALLGLAACGTSPAPEEAALDQTPSVHEFSWLVGRWQSRTGGVLSEETWDPSPWGKMMLGRNRTVSPSGEQIAFESLHIGVYDGGVFYVASPDGAPGTPFELVEWGPTHVIFENLEHDFPKRIIYLQRSENELEARAVGADGRGPRWRWTRVD